MQVRRGGRPSSLTSFSAPETHISKAHVQNYTLTKSKYDISFCIHFITPFLICLRPWRTIRTLTDLPCSLTWPNEGVFSAVTRVGLRLSRSPSCLSRPWVFRCQIIVSPTKCIPCDCATLCPSSCYIMLT